MLSSIIIIYCIFCIYQTKEEEEEKAQALKTSSSTFSFSSSKTIIFLLDYELIDFCFPLANSS